MLGCSRWLPWSTRIPATVKLPAIPPTAAPRSSTVTARPGSCGPPRGREPGRPSAEHDEAHRADARPRLARDPRRTARITLGVRINQQLRICFRGQRPVRNVEIVDYH